MTMPTAAVLLAHGSPDPDWARSVERTRDALATKLPAQTVAVATLATEHGAGLSDVVGRFVDQGHRAIGIVSLFLSSGGRHVKRDIPALVSALQQTHPEVTITLVPGALGEDLRVSVALADAAAAALSQLG